MNEEQSFERNARAWLELGPTDLPDRVVVNTLRSIESTPQERDLRFPWKGLRMSTPMRFAAAAAFAALALGGGLVLRNQVPSIGAPSQTPSTGAPSQTPVATIVQAEGPPWLVFESMGSPTTAIETSDFFQLWAVHGDGAGLHVLASGMQASESFDISPDGATVVFAVGGESNVIWEAPIGGGPARSLSTGCLSCAGFDPTYSPDGKTVAFTRWESGLQAPGIDRQFRAVVVLLDLGTGATTPIEATSTNSADGMFMHPTWSPDGTRIAIAWTPNGHVRQDNGDAHIAVLRIDGTSWDEFPWPAGAQFAASPDWSPDGSRIVFTTSALGQTWGLQGPGTGPWIYTISPDGDDLQVVCPACPVDVRFASWTPDGTQVLVWDQRSWALMDPDVGTRTFLNEQALTFPGAQFGLGSPALLQPTR